jgi:primase-polymerase (primpol)-like protein
VFWTLRQFIVCGGDDGKLPIAWDATQNKWKACDPHDPKNWLTHQEAVNAGYGVGFVFTDDDPYFFIDLDKCRDDAGVWTPEAIQVAGMFPGAMMEVSRSGRGMHIIASCDKSYLLHKKNKFNGWIEFLHQETLRCVRSVWVARRPVNRFYTAACRIDPLSRSY